MKTSFAAQSINPFNPASFAGWIKWINGLSQTYGIHIYDFPVSITVLVIQHFPVQVLVTVS